MVLVVAAAEEVDVCSSALFTSLAQRSHPAATELTTEPVRGNTTSNRWSSILEEFPSENKLQVFWEFDLEQCLDEFRGQDIL